MSGSGFCNRRLRRGLGGRTSDRPGEGVGGVGGADDIALESMRKAVRFMRGVAPPELFPPINPKSDEDRSVVVMAAV